MAAITTAAIGLATAGAQIIGSASAKAKNQKRLDNLEVPDLNNAYENMQIPTIGTDLKVQEDQRGLATGVDTLKSGGVRSVVGGLPQLSGQYGLSQEKNRSYIDDFVWERDKLIAGDDKSIRETKWQSYQDEVAGLGTAINAENQNMWNGIRGAGASLGSFAGAIGGEGGGTSEDRLARVNARQTAKTNRAYIKSQNG